MTLQEAISRVRAILKSSSDAFFKDEEIKTWLNAGNDIFHSRKGIEERWTYAVLAGEQDIPFDFTIKRVHKLFYIPQGQQKILVEPHKYRIFDNYVLFNEPLPYDGHLLCYGERAPIPVSDNDDTFEIPREYEEALIAYAVSKAQEKDENPIYVQSFQIFLNFRNEFETKEIQLSKGKETKITVGW